MRRLALLGCLAAAAVAWGGEPVAEGGRLRPFALDDQHGVRVEVGATIRILVLSRDMDGGSVVKEALADADQRFLDERAAVYVADISRMPGVVSRLVALPRMRRRPYRVLCDRDGTVAPDLPHADGRATLITLDGLRVTGVRHFESPQALRRALDEVRGGAVPPPSAAGGDHAPRD
jgi:hypothetical protein